MKKRTYSQFSYADKFLWKAVIADDVTEAIRRTIGDSYVDDEVQIANLVSHLRSVGKGELADEFNVCMEENDLVEWRP